MKEFIAESISCLDHEDMTEKAYSGLIACLDLITPDKDGFINIEDTNKLNKNKQMSVFNPLFDGIYIPGSKRNYWCGYIDPIDFPLPETGTVYKVPEYKDCFFETISINRIKKLPKNVLCKCTSAKFYYETFHLFFEHGENPLLHKSYFAIGADGHIYNAIDRLKLRNSPFSISSLMNADKKDSYIYSAAAISLLADRRYLWTIETCEDSGYNYPIKIKFGVEPEMVKSLLFARDEPLTMTGRKRPILHWVQSHKRRIKENIDIDISKYLRGTTSFKINGLNFKITNPTKDIR